MRDYLEIDSVRALEVLDSRGNPTVQVEVVACDGSQGVALVPSGAVSALPYCLLWLHPQWLSPIPATSF